MLRFLRIRDFALIRELEVEFGPGLNLLTGETGSGKSIVVDALGFLVGERASPDMVRSGSDRATLEGVFSIDSPDPVRSALEAGGIDLENDVVIVRREISASGRSRIFLNNNLATLGLLATVGGRLADIHGQHEHHSLLSPASHLEYLDSFGRNHETAAEVAGQFSRLRQLAEALDSGRMDEQTRLKRIDILRYQVEEIEGANLHPGEREELEAEKSILANRERIHGLVTSIYEMAYEGEPSLVALLTRVLHSLEELEKFDSRWSGHREASASALYSIEDLAYFSRDYLGAAEFTPERLDAVEVRLEAIDRLFRKYGNSVDGILEYSERCAAELAALVSYSDRSAQLEQELAEELSSYLSMASRLSEKRRADARQLEKGIREELQAVSMAGTDFRVRFVPKETGAESGRIPSYFRPSGVDQVEFLVSPNQGEEPRPLARIASGGELSRIMLALKTLCGGDEPGRTLIFDEVDAGIGGRAAEAVGRRLRDLARRQQVLCVTHLPQIAAFADRHYHVHKESVGSRTETRLDPLKASERVAELARMLGGEKITEAARRHASEMLASSAGYARKG